MKVLSVEELKEMKPHEMFASGLIVDSPEGANMTNSGKMLRWVAVRGGIHDWAIYCHWEDKSKEWIRDMGDKIHNMDTVKKLVPCDEEAEKMYRH